MKSFRWILILLISLSHSSVTTGQISAQPGTYYPTKILVAGEWEFKMFNNYYTQTENGWRSNFFSSFLQFLLGTNQAYNLGIDVELRSVNAGLQSETALFSALQFKTTPISPISSISDFARFGIAAIGPRIKYQPFADRNNIIFQHALYIPVAQDQHGNEDFGYFDFNAVQLYNNVWIEKELSPKRRLFFDIGLWLENFRLGIPSNESHFMQIQMPFTFLYNFYPYPKTTFYSLINVAPKLDFNYTANAGTSIKFNPYAQVGAGFKYFIFKQLEGELLYTYFVDTEGQRHAQTFNFGLRLFH